MLVLTRRINENILISDLGIEVQVLKVRGRSVVLGIKAPAEIKVLRGELVDERATAAIHGLETADRQTPALQPVAQA